MIKLPMSKSFSLMLPTMLIAIGMSAVSATAQTSPLYNPIPLPSSNEVTDTLSEKDIPTGTGGFSRDYAVQFKEGDQVVIDLTSDQFDTILTLIGPDGATVGENDDGPDGTTNSLLFTRVTRPGNYVVRVAPYAGQGLGSFNLKVTRLRPI
ncbi:MAG TPA: PPC domain-containing protein [Trichocoleus sp.]